LKHLASDKSAPKREEDVKKLKISSEDQIIAQMSNVGTSTCNKQKTINIDSETEKIWYSSTA